MTVDVADLTLHAARECSYCGKGDGLLVDDGEGGWMHADGVGCARAAVTVAGLAVPLAALDTPLAVPTHERQVADLVALVLSGETPDPRDESEKVRRAISRALRAEVARAHERIARTLRGLPDLTGGAVVRALEAAAVEARAATGHLAAWELACAAARGETIRAAQRRARVARGVA